MDAATSTANTTNRREITREVRQTAKCKRCKVANSRLVMRTLSQSRTAPDMFGNQKWITVGEFSKIGATFAENADKCACGRSNSWVTVSGKVSDKHQCGAKCLNSTGTTCECSCGGKNHGAGHARQ